MYKRKPNTIDEMHDVDLDYTLENMPMTDSCDAVRRKIRALIASGEMEVGDFQKALNTSSKGFASFMALHGPYHGSESSVYYSAWAFFKKRELRGVKTAKRIKIASSAGPHESQVDISDVGLKEEATDDTEAHGTNSYLWWLFCAWGALALATDAVWDFTFD